ncbi:MAG: hypothetical protein DRJ51_01480 [Thermoprotei archaeon]|nr:MAG: hypothetical protein DRJ51_01480 [Thermoprotei archaeon]RLF03159.1 MAG: hypothetical protein DRJ59_01560 [Thermoprotei archaeon]
MVVKMEEDANFLKRFYEDFTRLHREYNEAVAAGEHDKAIKLGEKIITMLIDILKEKIAANLASPITLKIIDDILKYYERNLSYIQGIKEAAEKIPLLYSYQAKERALETLARDVQELFSLVLGALIILSETSYMFKKKEEEESLRGYV